jgi:O-antigen ligase
LSLDKTLILSTAEPAPVPGKKTPYQVMDRILFFLIFLLVFLPMPTIEGPAAYLAPVVITVVFFIYILNLATTKISIPRKSGITMVILLMLAVLSIYSSRVLLNQEWYETKYFISRILTFISIFFFLIWMESRRIPLKAIYKTIFYSVLLISLGVIFIGTTDYGDLGGAQRTLIIKMPFYKNLATPRSYGEFGIFVTAAWAYYLLFKQEYNFLIRIIMAVILILTTLITQSRSTWLAFLIVYTVYIIIKYRLIRRAPSAILTLTMVLPFVVFLAITTFGHTFLLKGMVGEGIWEKNVYSRFEVDSMAIGILAKHPLKMLVGMSHADWMRYFPKGEIAVGLHNHFLSNIVFLGMIAGSFYLLLYLTPMIRIIKSNYNDDTDAALMMLVSLGLLTCLHFYEGFFSPIASLEISTLWYFRYLDVAGNG